MRALISQNLISQRKISTVVRRLARQIDAACKRDGLRELTVLCVMDGAFVFTADLLRAMRTPTRVAFVKATSYAGARKGVTRVAGLPASLRGKPILIADTIYDTGRTIARVVAQSRRLASSVWLAVLLEKQGKAKLPAVQQADCVFVGLRIAGDPFLVGYGLDVSGEFRNLPEIREHRPIRPAVRRGREER